MHFIKIRGKKFGLWAVLLWLIYVAILFTGLEIAIRYKLNYLIFPLKLKKSVYSELDKVRVWNQKFVAPRQEHFAGWPTPLKIFTAETDTPRYLFKPNMKMTYRDNHFVPAQPGDNVSWSSNSWGFRGKEFSVDKPKGIIRIVTLGASTTEGSQQDNRTYPFYLEQILQEKGYRVEVINAGHHGQDINDNVAVFSQRVLPLKPDIVIFYEANNNLYPGEWVTDKWHSWYSWEQGYGRWFRLLHQYSATFVLATQALGFEIRQPPPLPHTFSTDSPKPSLDNYRSKVKELIQLAKEHQVQPVLATFITVASSELQINQENNPDLWKDIYLKWHPFTPEEIEIIYDHYNNAIKELAARENIPLIDLAAQYPKDPLYFKDHIHFLPEGNQLLAQYLAKFLEEEILPLKDR